MKSRIATDQNGKKIDKRSNQLTTSCPGIGELDAGNDMKFIIELVEREIDLCAHLINEQLKMALHLSNTRKTIDEPRADITTTTTMTNTNTPIPNLLLTRTHGDLWASEFIDRDN
ncbi:unnamed protein product [Rotaria sordida]|nr:unnamed protein product [Rotaria sordida]